MHVCVCVCVYVFVYADVTVLLSPLQLLQQHKAELSGLERRLNNDRSRQVVALREKLAARKERQLQDQKRKQETELQKELHGQHKEIVELKTKQVIETLATST